MFGDLQHTPGMCAMWTRLRPLGEALGGPYIIHRYIHFEYPIRMQTQASSRSSLRSIGFRESPFKLRCCGGLPSVTDSWQGCGDGLIGDHGRLETSQVGFVGFSIELNPQEPRFALNFGPGWAATTHA